MSAISPAEIERIFRDTLAVLMDELNRRYAAAVAPLDSEAAALTQEYAGIAEEAQKLATVLPALTREAQRQADALTIAGDHSAAQVKLAEVREAEKLPLAMEQRQKEISDRYDRIPAEKVAIAQKVYEQMYPEMQAVVRLAETGFFIDLLDGLTSAAEAFQRKTGSAQNEILRLNRMSALTADGRSKEWASGTRRYGSRR